MQAKAAGVTQKAAFTTFADRESGFMIIYGADKINGDR